MGFKKWTWLAVATAMGLGGCGGDDPPFLTDIAVLAPGSEECPAGGHALVQGHDRNGNGAVDPEEVSVSRPICADGSTLLATSLVPQGDPNCEFGGTQVAIGDDDGIPAGTASDGVLQPEEIDQLEYICNTSRQPVPGSVTPPAGPAGAFTIDARGGDSSGGSAGDGGYVDVEFDYGSGGGHIKFFATGVADASFEVPTVTPDLGAEPLVVSSDLTITTKANGDHAGLTDGQYFMEVGFARIFRWDATNVLAVPVTGVQVDAAATLTLAANNVLGGTSTSVTFDNDVSNAGTITTQMSGGSPDRVDLTLNVDNFYGAPGSLIDLSGAEDPGDVGGHGGDLAIDAQDEDYAVDHELGTLLNQGTIDTSGADGTVGGSAGSVTLDAGNRVINTGAVDATGGRGTTSNGGAGANVDLRVDYGNTYNSGAIDASGGDGATAGGSAGQPYLYVGYLGDVRNTGDITADGGDSAASCAAGCAGGAGAEIELVTYSGDVITSGTLSATGGSGAAGPGGDGGSVYIWANYDEGWYGSYHTMGDVNVSGDLRLAGGAGATGGGDGGYVIVEWDCEYVPLGQEVVFYGYTGFELDGGEGAFGGDGGYVDAYNTYGYDDSAYLPSGGVINYVDVSASGGPGTNGSGGDGGYLWFETDQYYGSASDAEVVINHGNLDANGGAGTIAGGNSGYFFFFGYNGVENHGDLSLVAGNGGAVGDTTGGSTGGDVEMYADLGTVVNTGDILVQGGDGHGAGSGGYTNPIQIVGEHVVNSGSIDLLGGDGGATGTGGDSEVILLYSTEGSTDNTGALSALGGGGMTPGQDGQIAIDGSFTANPL